MKSHEELENYYLYGNRFDCFLYRGRIIRIKRFVPARSEFPDADVLRIENFREPPLNRPKQILDRVSNDERQGWFVPDGEDEL